MDEMQFNALKKSAPEMRLRKTKTKLKALKEELPVLGEVDMANETRAIRTTIIIIEAEIDSPPLIGRQTLDALGMLLIDETSGLKRPNKIKTVKQEIATTSKKV